MSNIRCFFGYYIHSSMYFSFNFLINQFFFQYSRWCRLKSNLIPTITRKMLSLLFHFSNVSLLFHSSNARYCFIFLSPLLRFFIFSIAFVIVSFSSIVLFLFHFLLSPHLCFIFAIIQKIRGGGRDWIQSSWVAGRDDDH